LHPPNENISQQVRDEYPGIDALAALLQTTLQTSIHTKPSTHTPFTPDQVNSMPIKDYVDHLKNNDVT
jgi:hypothetical protein